MKVRDVSEMVGHVREKFCRLWEADGEVSTRDRRGNASEQTH